MKIARYMTTRKASRSTVEIEGRNVPLWATTRLGRGAVAVAGAARNVFRAYASRTHGTDIPEE